MTVFSRRYCTLLYTAACDPWTKSQAVARTADRTASQHLWGSRDVIGHVTIWYVMSFPICGPLEWSRGSSISIRSFVSCTGWRYSNNQSWCTSVYCLHGSAPCFVRWQMSRLVSDSVPVHLHHWLSAAPDSLTSVTKLFRSPRCDVCLEQSARSCHFRTFC